VWYFTPFYAILRAVPDKLTGAILMALAIVLFFFLPWLDRCKVKSIRYRGWIYKVFLAAFAVSFLVLMYLGLQPAQGTYVILARIFTTIYFAFFLLMPIYTHFEKTKPVPDRVTFHG
jgi:ubiquinol-cytochrome c reductase cytochrome b subunit